MSHSNQYLMGIDTVIEVDRRRVRSKARATDHGEVFTGEREINDILDLVKQEFRWIGSHFLEPSFRTSNFLVENLRRKLASIEERYSENRIASEFHVLATVSSIYMALIYRKRMSRRLLRILLSRYILPFFVHANFRVVPLFV